MCIDMVLKPSPLVFLGIALIVLLALGRVLKATGDASAIRTLDRAAAGLMILVVGALVYSQIWFAMIPLNDFMSGTFAILAPFPFGFIDVSNTVMSTP